MLEFHREQPLIAASAQIEHSVIVPPCYVGEHATVKNSVIGPYVSVGSHSSVENTVMNNSIVQNNSQIKNAVLENSMIGNASKYISSKEELNLGDYSHLTQR
jgi:glucose-1-phosphate thymidylyltransferase